MTMLDVMTWIRFAVWIGLGKIFNKLNTNGFYGKFAFLQVF